MFAKKCYIRNNHVILPTTQKKEFTIMFFKEIERHLHKKNTANQSNRLQYFNNVSLNG